MGRYSSRCGFGNRGSVSYRVSRAGSLQNVLAMIPEGESSALSMLVT